MIRFISHIFLLGFLTFSCHSQMVMESSSNESFGFNKKIDTIWRNDIVTQSFPITSLSSNDFADLQFLKDELTSASIVFLGENSHSVREYNLLKVRLIRYLHQELGYSMIAFESSPSNLRYVSDFREKLTPEKMLEMGLFSIWRTEEVRELMEYLKANPSLQLRGFDCQEHALDTHLVAPYYQKLLAGISQQLGDEYSTFIADFKNHTKVLPYNQREAFYQKGRVLEDRLAILQSSVLYDHPEFNVLTHHLNNLRFTLKMASYKDEEAGIAYRDSCMAANILNEYRRKKDVEKMVCWGHNVHIAKTKLSASYGESAGRLVHEEIGNHSYHIGLYAYQGSYGMRVTRKLNKPKKHDVESLLHESGFNISFCSLASKYRNSWAKRTWSTLYAGHYSDERLTPILSYDAIVLVGQISPPAYR